MLVRTWNLFHGNASPPERQAFLEQAVRLATADAPALVCLQELPVWSLERLEGWSGMAAAGDVAARPTFGPIPWPAEAGRVVTELHHGLLRSAFSGQGNAILIGAELRLLVHEVVVLNAADFRRREAGRLDLPWVDRIAWGKERRVCQVIRLRRGESTFVVANLHATNYPDKRLADAELLRAATFVDGFAEPREPVVLAGDFNLSVHNSRTLPALVRGEWGFEGATPSGIDHVLVRGFKAGAPVRWPVERRRFEDCVLSDHAPVERRLQ